MKSFSPHDSANGVAEHANQHGRNHTLVGEQISVLAVAHRRRRPGFRRKRAQFVEAVAQSDVRAAFRTRLLKLINFTFGDSRAKGCQASCQ